jgi:hypothetical protein
MDDIIYIFNYSNIEYILSKDTYSIYVSKGQTIFSFYWDGTEPFLEEGVNSTLLCFLETDLKET